MVPGTPDASLCGRFEAGGRRQRRPKALIDIEGEQWVIKFFNNEYVDAALIEHATMTLAAQAAAQVAQVIGVVNTWRAHFESIGVSKSDLESLAQRLDGDELLSQRQTFDAGQYQGAPPKRKPTSPFRRS